MTDDQYYAHLWLSRMWNVDAEIKALEERAATLLGAKITSYDNQEAVGGCDSNPTESKNIEYSVLMAELEKKTITLSKENNRTLKVIQMLPNAMYRGMLYSRYVLRKTWSQIGKDYNYEHSQAFEHRKKALDAISPYIPKEVIDDEQRFN